MITRAETDWLGSSPVFYNIKTKVIGKNINEVIDYNNLEFDEEGLNNYLHFGYSVFGQTVVKNVKFLEANQVIEKIDNELVITNKPDPAENIIGKSTSNPSEVMEKILSSTREWIEKKESVILPLSGGFDSRILAYAAKERKNVIAYTYGTSWKQHDSYEVIFAREIAQKNNLNWRQIVLGDYHDLCEEWYNLYGPSTQLHGMYQMEFYRKILEEDNFYKPAVLSGIVGDAFSGNVHIGTIKNSNDIYKLGYTHGVSADENMCLLKNPKELINEYYKKNIDKLGDEAWRIMCMLRIKMILLSYLIRVPEHYECEAWSPFLQADVSLPMFNLPEKERRDRKWQIDFFEKEGLNFENVCNQRIDYSNVLNIFALKKRPVEPLNVHRLSSLFKKEYLEEINRSVARIPIPYLPWYSGSINKYIDAGINFYNNRRIKNAYMDYLVIKPIDMLLKKSQDFRKSFS